MDVATRNRLKFASAALTCVLLTASSPASAAGPAAESSAVDSNPPQALATTDHAGGSEHFPAKPSRPAPSKQINDDDGGPLRATLVVPQTVLAPLRTEDLIAQDTFAARTNKNKILRAGVGRTVQMGDWNGNWYDVPTGRVWLGEIVSPGAVGLRVQFNQVALPKNADLAVTLPGAGDWAEKVEWVEVDARQRGEAVSPLIPGERVRIEYFVPIGGFNPVVYSLPFKIVGVQHFYRDPLSGEPASAAGSCHNDVTCYPAWASTAKAVARVTFVQNGSSYLCSGQLINSLNSDLTPYWLTANHCISSQPVASTAQFFWRYQTSTCGGVPPSLGAVPTSSGATLLSTGAGSDYSLLMIEGGLPSGLTWVGWTSASPANGTASTAIHHPSGDYKRISFGTKASNTTCGGTNHLRVNWTDGPTEGGSSGSGIFKNDTQQLYGQLHCGLSACGSETNDDYGAFSSTYPSISSLLAAGSDDVAEQNDTCAAARATGPGSFANRIVKSLDPDWYSISVPAGKTMTVTTSFLHADGDIDTALFGTCGGSAIATSAGSGNSEMMTVTNSSGAAKTYLLQVYLFADTRNSYTLGISIP